MVVLLMVLYYIIFSGIDVSGLTVAVIGFTLPFGAGIVAAYNGPPIDLDAVKNELPMTLLKSAVSSMEQMIVPDDEPGNHICLEILS